MTDLVQPIDQPPPAGKSATAIWITLAVVALVLVGGRRSRPVRDCAAPDRRPTDHVLHERHDGASDPGPLGGLAECGDGAESGIPVAVCTWVDRGVSGDITFYYRKVADVRAQFLSARIAIEKWT